jgi:hypothetical protein
MTASTSTQKLLIQLETALHRLVESFWEEPYRFFTESDAVTALQSWVAARPELAGVHHTTDGFEIGLLHREYPTFFRLSDQDPTRRQRAPYGRGHYDLVVLDPDFLRAHDAGTVTNRRFDEAATHTKPPLVAAVEFKLLDRRWKPDKDPLIPQDLGKGTLALQSPPDASAAYMCVLCRDATSEPGPLEVDTEELERFLNGFPNVRTVVAVSWPHAQRRAFVHYAGPWITGEPGSF